MKSRRHPLQRFSKWTASLLLTVCLIGCQGNTLYHVYQPVESAGWDKGDTLYFVLPRPLAATDGENWQIGIRHQDSYPYQDIWLTVDGDTVHLKLTNKDGRWSGNGIGGIRQFYEDIPVPSLCTRTDSIRQIKVTHLMKHNPLPGICNVGIHIRRKP